MLWTFVGKLIGIPGLSTVEQNVESLELEKNIGRKDQAARASAGTLALVALSFVRRGLIIRYLLGLIAIAGLVTSYLRFSPVYALIGYSSRKNKRRK